MDTKDLNREDTSGLEGQNDQMHDSASQDVESGNISDNSTEEEKITKSSTEKQKKVLDSEDSSVNNTENEKESQDTISQKKEADISEAQADISEEKEVVEKETLSETVEKSEGKNEKAGEKKDSVEIPENISELSKEELVNLLDILLKNKNVLEIRTLVEEIKVYFYKKHKVDVLEQKNKFIANGGTDEDFELAEDNSEIQFKELYKKFKELKSFENIKLEKSKEENLQIKYEIINKIKDLVNGKESINKTFHDFRELQNQWKETGLVPQGELKNLWETYHHHVEKFYDYVKINKELRDLDLKKNLEQKINLCEKAEELLLETNIPKAFKELQELHNLYREIGPIPREQKEEIWLRFKEATSLINKKHQEYYENLKKDQQKNLEAKIVLCEKVEELSIVEYHKPKKWEEISTKIIEMQKLWKTIGYASKKENNRVYLRFKAACDQFFKRKREFYEKNKEEQKNNLQLKIDLCVQAEALVESTDWKNTTQQLIDLQKKWKTIGPVPRKYSESSWKRFRNACDTFFKNKSDYYTGLDGQQEENLVKKKELINTVKNFVPAENAEQNLKTLMEYQKEWSRIGFVPLKVKDELQNEFRNAISEQFEKLNIDKGKRILLKYRQKIENLVSSNAHKKIEQERNKVLNNLRDYENEIALYENNIGFFAKSKNADSLLNDFTKKIEKTHKEIDILKGKLKILKSI